VNYVYALFGTLMSIAMLIPSNHIYHQRLLALVRALKGLPQPALAVCETLNSEWPFDEWAFRGQDLPTFDIQYSEEFGYKGRFEFIPEEEPARWDWLTTTEWLNLNKFISLLVAEDLVGVMNWFPSSGLIVLWHTLEFERGVQVLEDNIPVAAVWILTAGKWMRAHRELDMKNPWVAIDGKIQEYDGPDGFCDERWQFWKSKFRDFSVRNDLKDETKAWAQAAADHMVDLDTPVELKADL
jgi:hypothetical protein